MEERRISRARVANACDTCKQRRVKCSGRAPCGYCVRRREPESCRFTEGRRRRPATAASSSPSARSVSVVSGSAPPHLPAPSLQLQRQQSSSGSPVIQVRGSGSASAPPLPPPAAAPIPPISHAHSHSHSQSPHLRSHTNSPHLHSHADHGSNITLPSTIPPATSTTIPATQQAQQQPVSSPIANFEEHEHDETEVPREARLLCDAQGKLIFIGDCAPLSFFQTVRRLVSSRVDAGAFLPESGGYSALENNTSFSRTTGGGAVNFGGGEGGGGGGGGGNKKRPVVERGRDGVKRIAKGYLEATAGVVDLFGDDDSLVKEVEAWVIGLEEAGQQQQQQQQQVGVGGAGEDVVYYLVLAIGCQNLENGEEEGGQKGQEYFDYARDMAFSSLNNGMGDLGVASVQAFILITLYSLAACQINAAFLFFGIAARAAYSIGIHRTAVNARFGEEVGPRRDKLWKSLRVVDLYLSTSMGRPPATSDVDCTVPYRGGEGNLLNASVQIFLVIESIVGEVYSRRKISPRLTEGISRELRDWSGKWLKRLMDFVESGDKRGGEANGACQVLASYYYAVVLVSRPFLMVELHRRLSDGYTGNGGEGSGKSKLADACIDAAILMVEPVKSLIERGFMTRRAPMVVSWLFAASLVLGVGLLGGFGHIIEKHCRASIACLEYFAQADAHAVQYSLIAKSLLATALEYLEKREMQERLRRTESSSRIFGLMPRISSSVTGNVERRPAEADDAAKGVNTSDNTQLPQSEGPTPGFPGFDFESAFLGLTGGDPAFSSRGTPGGDFSMMMGGGGFSFGVGGEAADENTFGALNLFPLLEGDGHIDLANYF
ncbi:hypothetical protein QBC43DRAFT_291021 [Cladorrhinum sp. PSN259]|nr:hypothetical protein QBC43DRAFT_291021 [Cladorrhinum sp. PSN259]